MGYTKMSSSFQKDLKRLEVILESGDVGEKTKKKIMEEKKQVPRGAIGAQLSAIFDWHTDKRSTDSRRGTERWRRK